MCPVLFFSLAVHAPCLLFAPSLSCFLVGGTASRGLDLLSVAVLRAENVCFRPPWRLRVRSSMPAPASYFFCLLRSGNDLAKLPSTLGNLPRLAILIASSNSLTTLPDELGQLKTCGRGDFCLVCARSPQPFSTSPAKCILVRRAARRLVRLRVNKNKLRRLPSWIQSLLTDGSLRSVPCCCCCCCCMLRAAGCGLRAACCCMLLPAAAAPSALPVVVIVFGFHLTAAEAPASGLSNAHHLSRQRFSSDSSSDLSSDSSSSVSSSIVCCFGSGF